MIEPLQYNKEHYPTYEIARPVFCHSCLCQKNSRLDPKIAVKFCPKCPSSLGADKEYGAFLCPECDDRNHKSGGSKAHVRFIVVVGPGVRKKVAVRGDGYNFPLPLDHVTIKLSARFYQNGRRVHRVRTKEVNFISGMSGRCLHVQVLGARNLMVGDVHGSSDPFIIYSFCGKPLGSTRVRPRSTNPRWDNETFIVPMDENLPPPRDMPRSQRDLVRLEVYDQDWVTSSEFLGHVEITRSKLMKIAAISNQQPIRLPLTMKEYHGFVNLQFGFDDNYFHVKAVQAENLNLISATELSNPYVKIYLGNSFLVGTTPSLVRTVNPHWLSGNVFKIKMLQLLFAERYALSQIDAYNETQERQARTQGDKSRQYQTGSASQLMDEFTNLPTSMALLRVELYHDNRWRKHQLLGKAYISVYKLRKMLPTLPAADIANLEGYAEYVTNTIRADRASAKIIAQQQASWLSGLNMFGNNNDRPSSPAGIPPGAGAMGRLPPSALPPGAPGSASPVLNNRRRANLLGAASAPASTSAPSPTAAVDTSSALMTPAPLPPSRRPPPPSTLPPSTSAKSESSNSLSTRLENPSPINLPPGLPSGLSSRRKVPLSISVPSGSFSDLSQALYSSSPGLPINLPSDNQSESKSDEDRDTPASMTLGGDLVDDRLLTPLPAGDDFETDGDDIEQQLTGVAAVDRGDEVRGDTASSRRLSASRPAPPPLPSIADQSFSAASGSAGVDHSEDFTSNSRAPFFSQDHSSSNLHSRKSKRFLLGRSFRGPPEITWSDSYPFPVMMDLSTSHRGLDAFGAPVSQGFIVLRLIPATRGSVVLGLDEAVRQMTLGETAQVKCRYDYAYGSFSMGSHIPPRANAVFKVKLLELNGKGRYQVLYRMLLRFLRWFTRLYAALLRYLRGEGDAEFSRDVSIKKTSFSVRMMQSFGLSGRTNQGDSDSESSEEDGEDGLEEEDGFLEGDLPGGGAYAQEEGSEDGSSVNSDAQYGRARTKPDPRMRKHLNQSVTSGAQLMWNFKPPVKVKKPKAPTGAKGKGPLKSTAPLAPVTENKGDSDGEEPGFEIGSNGDAADWLGRAVHQDADYEGVEFVGGAGEQEEEGWDRNEFGEEYQEEDDEE